jgi:hypothetical protein
MKLLTEEIKKAFLKQGDTEYRDKKDIKIIVKYFNPCGVGKWYCYEYFPEDRTFMAFCLLLGPDCAELGYVSLDELESIRVPPFGLKIERDLYFGDEHTLQEVMGKVLNGVHV